MAFLLSASVCLFSSCQYIDGLLDAFPSFPSDKTECAAHSFGEWETVKEASCIAGEKQHVCGNCDFTETEEIPALEEFFAHTFDENTLCATCGHQEFIESEEYIDGSKYNGYSVTRWWSRDRSYALLLTPGFSMEKCFTIAGYEGNPIDIILPSTFNDCPIRYIGGVIGGYPGDLVSYGFNHCKTLESIFIPETVVNIYDSAFYKCTALDKITIKNPSADFSKNVFTSTAFWNNYEGDVVYLDDICLGYKEQCPSTVIIKEDAKRIVKRL
jgi:hypothetical protein